MKPWHLAVFALIGLVSAGCSLGQTHKAVSALERENRELEDRLYFEHSQWENAARELEASRKDVASLRQRLKSAGPAGPDLVAPRAVAPPPPNEGLKPPTVEMPGQSVNPNELPERFNNRALPRPSTPELPEAPKIEPPDEPATLPPPGIGAPNKSGNGARDKTNRSRGLRAAMASPPFAGNLVDNKSVARITLHRQLTGGYCSENRSEGGLTVVLEPRDDGGRLVPAAGAVSVVALDPDPSLTGDASRVGRWDLTADELAQTYRKTALGEGFFLDLPWPAAPPRHDDLEIFIRYSTNDGRKLQVQRSIRIEAANPANSGGTAAWTPASATADKAANSNREPSQWQTRPTPPPAPVKPPRVASVPAETISYPTESAAPPPRPSTPPPPAKPAHPVWSPDRPQ